MSSAHSGGLALCAAAFIATAAHAELIVPSPTQSELMATADRLHPLVVRVHARVPVSLHNAEGAGRVVEADSYGSGALVGGGFAVVGMHAVTESFTLLAGGALDPSFWCGPLFDAQGRLAGVVLASKEAARAVPASIVKEMIARAARAIEGRGAGGQDETPNQAEP